jgi:hypothetical protein
MGCSRRLGADRTARELARVGRHPG